VLVFNSGSSSVKFALLLAGSGERSHTPHGRGAGTRCADPRVPLPWMTAAHHADLLVTDDRVLR
jgi:hypothetical protein